jgi:sugar (pentulose or hexulose) kinase
MQQIVTAIFDIGKTNKKFLLFDEKLKLLHQEETVFDEITDDDGFPCEDIVKLAAWVRSTIERTIQEGKYQIKHLNFSTYGATLVYLNADGIRITPLYNYLKPMPDGALEGFYERYGGKEEFSRQTASPALNMLNSGMQIYWLKNMKPVYWKQVKNILHLPQYMSYLFTEKIVAGLPSIGCHTAIWDFDNMKYHKWISDEKINLPDPVPSDTSIEVNIGNATIETGIGIHDSSASLVPYLRVAKDKKFILVSTGTWAINMNPFSSTTLTADELKHDCLCYLSTEQKQVKSSRLFLGHIHEVNTKEISRHYGICSDVFKCTVANEALLKKLFLSDKLSIFKDGITENYLGNTEILKSFESPVEAYHQLMYELTKLEANAISLVYDNPDTIENIYITGGFVKNDIFCKLLATFLKNKKVFKAEIYNATALGTAMVINKNISASDIEINMEEIQPLYF